MTLWILYRYPMLIIVDCLLFDFVSSIKTICRSLEQIQSNKSFWVHSSGRFEAQFCKWSS